MKKFELIELVKEAVKGKNYSDTDIGVMFCDTVDSEFMKDNITIAQRQNWILAKTELSKLRKITKCNCNDEIS